MAYRYGDATPDIKKAVWKKGSVIEGYDPNVYRRDICGTAMQYDQHGKGGKYGWEIDHIKPSALGGSDELFNLQPLYWQTNQRKSDTYPWSC